MNMFPIKSTLGRFYVNLFLLTLALLTGVLAVNSQTTENPQPQQLPSENSLSQIQPNQTRQNDAIRPTVILVPDVSFSVQKSIKQMRNVMQQIIYAAPENAMIGIVTVGTQSEKRVFANREDAVSYLPKISANSNFTDLERGTDSALAVIQEVKAAKPTLIVYLTDGEVSLPKELKNKADFKTILNREFLVRPDVRVMVLNVSLKPMNAEGFPSNITVVPLSNWEEAEKQMKQTLAVQIQNELKPVPAVEPIQEVKDEPLATSSSRQSGLIWGISVIAVIGLGFFGFWMYQRRRVAETAEEEIEVEPLNLLRPEDILRQSDETSPNLVALVEFYDGEVMRSEQLMNEESRVVGKATTADVRFTSLKQENSLEIKFNGKQITAFRLHPQISYEVDEVWLNRVKVPLNQTKFHLQNSDMLKIGNVQITVKIVESSVAQILNNKSNRFARQSFRSDSKTESSASSAQRLKENKSRWN